MISWLRYLNISEIPPRTTRRGHVYHWYHSLRATGLADRFSGRGWRWGGGLTLQQVPHVEVGTVQVDQRVAGRAHQQEGHRQGQLWDQEAPERLHRLQLLRDKLKPQLEVEGILGLWSDTHTHTHTCPLTYTQVSSHTHTQPLSLRHTLILSHTQTLTHTHILSQTHSHKP